MTPLEPLLPRSGRRLFLQGAAATATTLLTTGLTPGQALAALGPRPRTAVIHHLHTGEKLKATYWADGSYIRGALDEVNTILRDFRTGDVYPIDVGLLDLLQALRARLDTSAPYEVISGYRSPETNAALAAKSDKVAKNSLHMRGMAIDITVPDRDLPILHRAARSLRGGGVGYYPKIGFVHVDVGSVRYW